MYSKPMDWHGIRNFERQADAVFRVQVEVGAGLSLELRMPCQSIGFEYIRSPAFSGNFLSIEGPRAGSSITY